MGKKSTKETLADETNLIVDRILKCEVDGIIAGFPCQDISVGNRVNGGGTGIAGKRSGLFWPLVDTIRMVRHVNPRLKILLENVAALFRSDGADDMGTILGTLASEWRHTEWDCVSAGAVGAPHHRARAYFFADDTSDGKQRLSPKQICRQPDFAKYEDVRGVEDLRKRSDLFGPLLCRGGNGVAKRLHGIGNGNPPCIIRELTKGLK